MLISVMKHLDQAPKGAVFWLLHPPRLRGEGKRPLRSPGLRENVVWKRHDAEGEAPVGSQAHEASMPPNPHTSPSSEVGGHWDSCPLHNLVPGLGWDGSFLVSGPQAGPGSFPVPFLSPSKPSLWPSEKLMSSVLNCLILPLPVPLLPREEMGGDLPSPNPTSHNGTASGLFLLESRRDEFRTTRKVEQSLGEASDRALRGHRIGLVQTHNGRCPEDAVDTLF